MSNTKHLTDLFKVCSVLPALLIMPAMAETFNIGTGGTYTLTGKHIDPVTNEGSVYFLQSTDKQQLAVLNVENALVSNITMSEANGQSGVIKGYDNSKVVVRNSEFSDNNAPYYAAIWTVSPWQDVDGGILDVSGSKFLRNKTQDGGAIGAMWKTKISDSLFESNETAGDGGGAMLLGAVSQSVLTDVMFKNNSSETVGGAIAMRAINEGDNKDAKLDIFDSDFIGNTAGTNGGAIYSTFYDSKTVKDSVYINDTDFSLNSANNGGAIYTEGLADLGGGFASMKIVDTDFNENTATNFGGAIYNSGNLILSDGDFENNAAGDGGAIFNKGVLTVNGGSEFIRNTVALEGGAIYNGLNAKIDDLLADFKFNSVERSNSGNASGGAIFNGGTIGSIVGVFNDNVAIASDKSLTAKGGAIYSWADGSAHATIDSVVADFNGNQVKSVGEAIGGAIVNDGKIGTLYQADQGFVGNKADAEGNAWAGAFYNSEYAEIKELIANFDDNSANGVIWGAGGAVVNRGNIDKLQGNFTNNSVVATTESDSYGAYGGALFNDGVIGALTGDFINNSAFATMEEYASGGAIENMGTLALVGNNLFRNNVADYGGAIDNCGALNIGGTNVFSNNIARFGGGAISNWETEIVLSGTNTFSGNTANGVANDIYNDGTLTIASGMTSIDGGINGAGALDIQSDATLNMNYASITQGTINIDGTLMASLRDASDTVDIAGTLSGTGKVLLSAGAVGTYDVSLFTDANLNVDFGKTYQTTIEDGMAILGVKDVATIAADTGITGGAAGAVSTLVVSSDANLQKVSLAIQEALNNGDTALVEKEMAKVNPDTKPVGQSVAASVQGQVVSVAAGRMSTVGGTTGRAGGDVTGAGLWTQGLVNKSKMGGTFEGRTTGFALGGDTLIDDVFTLGGGFAFSDTDVEADGRDTNVESNSVFAYAQYKPSAWYANATVSYTMSDYEEDAQIIGGVMLNNNYDTKAFGVQTMFGYDFASGVTPEAGVRYLYVSQDEHRNGIGNIVSEMDYGFWTGVAGLKYAFAIESDTDVKFSPSLRAAMTYDFTTPDTVAKIVVPGASAYYVDIDSLSRMGGEFGIGLTAEYRGLELSLNYELDLHEDYTSQTGLLKFRYDF